MNLRRARLLVLCLYAFSLIGLNTIHAQDEADADGIPANCENIASSYANVNLFPRYAAGENRLVLIDWSSGDVVRELETGISDPVFWLIGWSPDCHYLAGGLGDGETFTTVIWDAVNGGRVGSVEDAFLQPHKLTWSPLNDSVVVETRHGAFLWTLATGQRLQLTVDSFANYSFRSIEWNYSENVLETRHSGGVWVNYSLTTGHPVNFSLPENTYIGSGTYTLTNPANALLVSEPSTAAPYACIHRTYQNRERRIQEVLLANVQLYFGADRLAFVDVTTGEIVSILASDLETYLYQTTDKTPGRFAPGCEFVFTALASGTNAPIPITGLLWRIADSTLIATFDAVCSCSPQSDWDETGRYLFIQTYNGAQVWDSETNRIIWLTTADESSRRGYSITDVIWDSANHTITVDIRFSEEFRTFDLLTGNRIDAHTPAEVGS